MVCAPHASPLTNMFHGSSASTAAVRSAPIPPPCNWCARVSFPIQPSAGPAPEKCCLAQTPYKAGPSAYLGQNTSRSQLLARVRDSPAPPSSTKNDFEIRHTLVVNNRCQTCFASARSSARAGSPNRNKPEPGCPPLHETSESTAP